MVTEMRRKNYNIRFNIFDRKELKNAINKSN